MIRTISIISNTLNFIVLICNKEFEPLKHRRVCGIALVRGYVTSLCSLEGFLSLVFHILRCHRLSGISIFKGFMPATSARPKAAKISQMDCTCLCSEVEISLK